MRPVLAVRNDSQYMNCNCSEENRQDERGGHENSLPLLSKQEKLTGARAHRGVLNIEESLGISRHGGGGVGEFAKRQERRLIAIEDGGEGTKSRGRARWGGGY